VRALAPGFSEDPQKFALAVTLTRITFPYLLFVTPVLRSFVAIPAGLLEMPLRRYTLLTIPGSAVWCFGLAGVGWALGSQWEEFHHAFHYVDYAVLAMLVAGAVWLGWKYVRRRGKPATEPR
jgi:membrane protein DedA with SNARE-associated domain